MSINELLVEWSYRTEKGYPDMGNPSDILILKEILENLGLPVDSILDELGEDSDEVTVNNDEIPQFSKADLIALINNTEMSSKEAEKLATTISDLHLTSPITDYLDNKSRESNIPEGEIDKFKKLLKELEIQKEFAEYIKNPVDLDINLRNFTDSISVIPSDKLKVLYRKIPTSIVSNVSVGPAEVLFSILFKNVRKRDSKGDLDIGDKNVEVKASIGNAKVAGNEKGSDAGAVVAKGYGRGSWSATKKTGKFEEWIDELGMSEENTKDAKKVLTASLKWPLKTATIFDIFTNDENYNKETFISSFGDVLKRIYHKSSFIPNGDHFNLSSYFSDNDFNSKEFEIGIARELVDAYKTFEQFSGMLYLNRKGDMKYFDNDTIIQSIGTDIVISSFSDDVPRLLFKGHSI